MPDVKAILFLLSEGRERLLECVDHVETPDHQKDQSNFEMQKLVLIWIVFVLLEIIFFKYMEWRVTRFLRGHCPNQRMSCIGKYKRNVINFKQTAYLMLIWQVNLLLDFPFQTFLEKEETFSSESKFLIWVAKGIFLNEGFIFFQLAIKVDNTKTKLVQPGHFYVRPPTLEPRRMWLNKREYEFENSLLDKDPIEGCSEIQSNSRNQICINSFSEDEVMNSVLDEDPLEGCSEIQNNSRNHLCINSFSDLPRGRSSLPEVYDTSN